MKNLNFVFILADQLRHDFLSCYGAQFIETPNIDRIVSKGIKYEKAYSQSPLCVPARASLLTGRNGIRNGVCGNWHWLRPDLNESGIKTWPEILSENGYYTAAIGKMHFYPWDECRGFQYRVIAEDKRWLEIRDDYYKFLREHGHRKYHGMEHDNYQENRGAIINKLPTELTVDRFVGDQACRFIDNYGKEKPFAMMVGFPSPHCPYDPTEEYLDLIDVSKIPASIPETEDIKHLKGNCIEGSKGDWNGVDYTEFTEEHKIKIKHHYAALVKQIDDEIGKIFDSLEKNGLMENTVIILSSDHGDYLGDHGLIGKDGFFEASTHIPLLVYIPWLKESISCDSLVTLTDVTATILSMSGHEIPEYMDCIPLPGTSGYEERREIIIGMLNECFMAYDGRYKLSKYQNGDMFLYDLKNDPNELNNLINKKEYMDIYFKLDKALTSEILESIIASNYDRTIERGVKLWKSEEYGKQGFIPKYPKKYT